MEERLLVLEREACSRCGGTGKHSYCQRFGDVCFKCGGRKTVFSKRGQAANAVLTWLLSRPTKCLQPGDRIVWSGVGVDGATSGWATVQSIEPVTEANTGFWRVDPQTGARSLPEGLLVTTDHGRACGIDPEKLHRVALNAERKAPALRAVAEFQANLTKSGTYRRRGGRS